MSKKPLVGIVMGSDSDWPLVKKAVDIFKKFEVEFEARVISAHRTPELAAEYASSAESRGLQVVIAAAGGAAHLGGVLAAHTVIPVIGIPVAGGALNGLDSLYATIQMPAGIPVATMTLGSAGPVNAALFAIQILGGADPELRTRFHAYKEELKAKVIQGNEKINADLMG
jgi:phosphoribosylaminoimidazole carboxylase PurE protein